VGTRLGSVEKPLWQVKLKAGEEVEILGEASWPSPDGNSTVWYQIAPPAGEFRWIRFADLSTPPTSNDLALGAADQTPAIAAETDSKSNVTDSGFRYVSRNDQSTASPSDSESQTRPPAELKTESGFRYVASEKTAPAKTGLRNGNVREPSSKTSVVVAQNRQPSSDDENNKWVRRSGPKTRSPFSISSASQSGSTRSLASRIPSDDSGRLRTDPRTPSRSHASVSQSSLADSGRTSIRQSNQPQGAPGIDFKFRTISQTATVNGSFQSSSPFHGESETIVDSAVVQAAYQFDDRRAPSSSDVWSGNEGESHDARWQRGRPEIAQQRSQHEAKYEQFNQRNHFDHRDVEDSFGVRWEDLPSHRRTAGGRNVWNGDRGTWSRGDQGSADFTDNGYSIVDQTPPYDRYASLSNEFELLPHSTLAEKLTGRLSKAEQQLTNEMLKRPNEWQLADLELAVGQVYSQTTNPMERLQSQRILDKISKCKVIRNGYTKNFQATGETFGTSVRSLNDARTTPFSSGQSYGAASVNAGSSPASPAGLADRNIGATLGSVVGSGVDTDFELGARYDAVGWLTELVSEDRNNRPVYVLVDDRGQITHHLGRVPGLNLNRYLKSKIGVIGRRGYNNRMKMDHITAESIDELQRN
jgi:hypothetical protein